MLAKTVFLVCCTLASVNAHVINKRQTRRSTGFSNLNPILPSSGSPSSFNQNKPSPQNYQETSVFNSILELAMDISANEWEHGYAGNVVQSPISLASILSLLLLGSRGNTYSELKRTLHYPNDITDSSIHQTYKKILENIGQTNSGVEVLMSSRIFMQEGLPIIGQFTKMAEESYGSQVRGLDFARNPNRATNTVNQWVADSTKGKITDLITTPFSRNTKFVAANAIYFNGDWQNQFNERLTENGFFNTGTRNISIPMMSTLMDIPYYNGDQIGFDMASLPYKGGKYSMLILTPRGKPGLQSLQRMEIMLDSDILNNLISRMTKTRVSVTIPRMKLSHKIYLKKNLKSLGVNDMFEESKADFGRLTTQSGIFVNDIVHEAILEVTETGTVAAAASAATFDRIGGNEVFRMDRPSLLLIRDDVNGLILFWARVMEPEAIFN